MLYNGKDPYPEKKVLRLSDAFEDAVKLGIPEESLPPLELTVTVYNINQGYNGEMVRRCEKLRGYCVFVAKVREIEAEGRDLGTAVEGAVKWCIKNEVLKGFFETHGSEVVNMLMAEWNIEDALVVEREEGWEEGQEYGWEKGREKGLTETARNALAEGLPTETVQKITGLDIETLKRLSVR